MTLNGDKPEFQLLLDASPDAMVAIDGTGLIRHVNDRTLELFGYRLDELLGQSAEVFIPQQEQFRAQAPFGTAGESGPPGTVIDSCCRRKDGRIVPTEVTLSRERTAEETLLIAAIRDATERRTVEEQLRLNAARFGAVFHEAPIGMALTSLRPGSIGRIFEVNAALCATLGRSREELLGAGVDTYAHPDEHAPSSLQTLASGVVDNAQFERRYITGANEVIWLHIKRSVVAHADGTPEFAVSHLEDVTSRRNEEAQLRRAATHDALTGLPNRALLMDRLRQQLGELVRSPGAITLFYLDLDRFKRINDTLGHQTGDDVLIEVAGRLRRAVRPTDTPSRIGGDEFVVLCRDIADGSAADAFAQRLITILEGSLVAGDQSLRPRTSVGVASTRTPDADADELLHQADLALYEAKAAGRGRVAHYRPAGG